MRIGIAHNLVCGLASLYSADLFFLLYPALTGRKIRGWSYDEFPNLVVKGSMVPDNIREERFFRTRSASGRRSPRSGPPPGRHQSGGTSAGTATGSGTGPGRPPGEAGSAKGRRPYARSRPRFARWGGPPRAAVAGPPGDGQLRQGAGEVEGPEGLRERPQVLLFARAGGRVGQHGDVLLPALRAKGGIRHGEEPPDELRVLRQVGVLDAARKRPKSAP